jgi:3-oxoacyl-(acyl-carrier-protein) synthase
MKRKLTEAELATLKAIGQRMAPIVRGMNEDQRVDAFLDDVEFQNVSCRIADERTPFKWHDNMTDRQMDQITRIQFECMDVAIKECV